MNNNKNKWAITDWLVLDEKNNVKFYGQTHDSAEAKAQATGDMFPLVIHASRYHRFSREKEGKNE